MLERAIMARARLLAQPADHPGARMLSLARSLSCTTWASVVAGRMAELTPPILDIDVHPAFRHPLRNARCSLELRRSLLRDFKLQVVRPALRARDLVAFQRAACARLPALDMSYAVLVPEPQQLPVGMLSLDFGPHMWREFRMWAVARMSGSWPLPVLGVPCLPVTLSRCAACGDLQVDIAHALCGSGALGRPFGARSWRPASCSRRCRRQACICTSSSARDRRPNRDGTMYSSWRAPCAIRSARTRSATGRPRDARTGLGLHARGARCSRPAPCVWGSSRSVPLAWPPYGASRPSPSPPPPCTPSLPLPVPVPFAAGGG